jgi:patatin-like phospholipase/acyl hydrolase
MQPFKKNLAIAVDGGGIKGVIVTTALTMLEEHLGYPLHERIGLAAGTSTGSIITTSLASGLKAQTINQLYLDLGNEIFRKSLRTLLWIFFNHRYPAEPLEKYLHKYLGDKQVIDLWESERQIDVVITTFDIVENRTRFIKPYKGKYHHWSLVKAVRASAAAPTYFPSVDGRFVDGGVGSYNNPCYLAAYEILFSLKWKPEETTLISIGTGRDPNRIKTGDADRFLPIQYVSPLLTAFNYSAADQQVDLVSKLFDKLDFRRYQVDLKTSISLDDPLQIPALIKYGEKLGKMILHDDFDRAMNIHADPIPGIKKSTSRRQKNKSGSLHGSQSGTPAKSARGPRKRSPT